VIDDLFFVVDDIRLRLYQQPSCLSAVESATHLDNPLATREELSMTRPTWVMHSSAVIVVLAIVLTAPPGSAQQPPSSPSGLTVHPDTGELWQNDNGPQGGDEINIIKRGLNYGWSVVTYGRAYTTDPDGIRSGLPETQLSRIVFNERGLESRRETLLLELRQRIRDVRQGPDGLVYLTTDMRDGAILKLEPVAEP